MHMANASPNERGRARVGSVGTSIGSGELRIGSAGYWYLDTNMSVLAMQKSRVGGIAQHEPSMRGVSRCSGIRASYNIGYNR